MKLNSVLKSKRMAWVAVGEVAMILVLVVHCDALGR